jgi:integrase/recombinase XerD
MVDDSPLERYRRSRNRLDAKHEDGLISTRDYELITQVCDAYDPNDYSETAEETKEYTTLKGYTDYMGLVAQRLDGELCEATAEDLNEHMTALSKGTIDGIKDGGFSQGSVMEYQSKLRVFYRFHDHLDVAPEDIVMTQPADTPIDTDDLYTNEEVQRMRKATPNARDRCLLELFINTGQRVRAIQTLRIKDVWPDEGEFRLNPSVKGLKYAEGRRALFGARAAVKDWLDFHPTNDPEDYLITGLNENNPDHELGDMLSTDQIRRRMKRIGDRAEIDKPVNPHQFRHYSVTMMYKQYGLSLDQIRWQIGHGEESRVLEATYRHLTDGDRIEEVEQQAGFREESSEASPFTPPVCTVCDEPLPEDARYCPNCGESYAPDAKQAEDTMEEATYEDKGKATTEAEHEAVDHVREVMEEYPEAKEGLVEFIKRLEN